MKWFSVFLLIGSVFCCSGDPILLSLGEKAKFPLPHKQVLHIGDRSLVSLAHNEHTLTLVGKKQGQTFLSLDSKKYQLIVLPQKTKTHLLFIQNLLKNMWGLTWSLSPQLNIQITGTLNRIHDWIKLAELSQKHKIKYQFKAQMAENLMPAVLLFFKQLLSPHIPPKIQWQNLPWVWIPYKSNTSFYNKHLEPFGLSLEEDKHWFLKPYSIQIEVALVETQTSVSSFFAKTKGEDASLSFSSLIDLLDFLKSKKRGRTLHYSSLLAQNEQEVLFRNGGEIPFSLYNKETEHYSTQWKPYGLTLNITAFVGKTKNIQLKIQGEFSEPLSVSTQNQTPPLKSQNLKTVLTANNQDILLLFYQKKARSNSSSQGHFLFSSPLFTPFSNHQNKQEVSQMIFVRPTLVPP